MKDNSEGGLKVRVALLESEIERLRSQQAQTKEDWHNQYTTAMHLSAELAEAISERDDARRNNEILRNLLQSAVAVCVATATDCAW